MDFEGNKSSSILADSNPCNLSLILSANKTIQFGWEVAIPSRVKFCGGPAQNWREYGLEHQED